MIEFFKLPWVVIESPTGIYLLRLFYLRLVERFIQAMKRLVHFFNVIIGRYFNQKDTFFWVRIQPVTSQR